MNLLIMFLILFTIAVALCYIFNYRFEQTIGITCLLMILILYLFGIFELLIVGTYAIYLLAALSVLLILFMLVKGRIKKDFWKEKIITPGFVVFSIFFLISHYVHRSRVLMNWDEFSHWGRVVKNYYHFNSITEHYFSTVIFPGYPPGSSLFHYFWMSTFGFNESLFFIGMNILLFSLLLPLFKVVNWKSAKMILPIALLVVAIPLDLFPRIYSEIYVDALMAILFANILFAYFTEKKYDKPFFANVFISLFVLTIIKASGFGLALIAALIITLDVLVKFIKERKKGEKGSGFSVKSVLRSKNFYIPGVALMAPILSNQSWSIFRSVTETQFAWEGVRHINFSNIMALLTGTTYEYRYVVINNFINGLFDTNVSVQLIPLNYFRWFLLITVLLLIWNYKSKGVMPFNIKVVGGGLYIGWAIYIVSLLVLYIFTFYEWEALRLASFTRYMNTYLLGMVISLSYLFAYWMITKLEVDIDDRVKRKNTLILTVFIAAILAMSSPLATIGLRTHQWTEPREEVTIGRIQALHLDYRTDRVWYIYQHTAGYQFHIAAYTMTPIRINGDFAWSIGTPSGEEDVWTREMTSDEWLEAIRRGGYTFVYINRLSENFVDEFGAAFTDPATIKEHSLYRVVDHNGGIILEYVDF